MKASKVIVPILMIIMLMCGWGAAILSGVKVHIDYLQCVGEAEQSIGEGLYAQAIEDYAEALEYNYYESVFLRIKDIYDMYYEEEHTATVRNSYIADMANAAQHFPNNEVFWLSQIELYLEAEDYTKAYNVVKQAINKGVNSEMISKYYSELTYMVRLDYKLYYDFYSALNGYITVFDGNQWTVLDETGTAVRGKFSYIGMINSSGKGLYINNIDARLIDKQSVTRARFEHEIEEAGYYSETYKLLPVKIDGKWKYMNDKGEFLPGTFEIAGCFYQGKAAAYTGTKWVLIDAEGVQTELPFEDVKLDLYGSYVQNGIIIAKNNGKYHFFDMEFVQIGEFEAEDIDICIGSNLIAFKNQGLWGFVDSEGNIKQEPVYHGAKSFANGYAAICDENGKWGFINEKFERIIDYRYYDAYYFTAKETCMVSAIEDSIQILSFKLR